MDWKRHKKLCSYLATAAEEVGADNFFGHQIDFGGDECNDDANLKEGEKYQEQELVEESPNEKTRSWKSWTKFRVNAAKMCEILIGRPLEPFEKEVFLFPRACRVCRLAKKEGMKDCLECMGVTYCSEQCLEDDLPRHRRKMCRELKYAMVSDNYESTITIAAPPVPSESDKTFQDELAASNIEEHLKFSSQSHQNDSSTTCDAVDMAEMEFRFLTDRLTGPLTIAYCGAKYGLNENIHIKNVKERFTVHIVGSNINEMLGIIKWEYLLHRLPNLQTLHLIFIGLELDNEPESGVCPDIDPCDLCLDQGRKIKYEIRKMGYENYSQKCQEYIVPDMVCAFNCGFHENVNESAAEKDTWKAALPFLVRHVGVPLIFTSYTISEAQKDLDLIRKSLDHDLNLKIEARHIKNPFRSHRSHRDFEYDNDYDVFYSNQYLSVVRRTAD